MIDQMKMRRETYSLIVILPFFTTFSTIFETPEIPHFLKTLKKGNGSLQMQLSTTSLDSRNICQVRTHNHYFRLGTLTETIFRESEVGPAHLKLKAEEDAVRELFINESPPVDPYYHLIDVFADKDSFRYDDPATPPIPVPIILNERQKKISGYVQQLQLFEFFYSQISIDSPIIGSFSQ
jgi:hypothetical protein